MPQSWLSLDYSFNNMLKLGELLKTKRKEKGLTRLEVSELIKIPEKHLTALEEGDYKVFASEVYLKGFLKNYSKFLGVRVEQALALYRRESDPPEETSAIKATRIVKEEKPIITPERLAIGIIVLIVILVVTFIFVQINKVIKPPSLSLNDPIVLEAPSEGYLEVNKNSILISGKIEAGSKLLINGNEVQTNSLREFRVENYMLNSGSNEIYIVAQSYYFSKTSQIKLTVMYQEESTTPGGESAEPASTAGDNI